MDREEFNWIATKKEIERSRWIGEQWEKGKNNFVKNELKDIFSEEKFIL